MFSTSYEDEAQNRGTVQKFITERRYLKNVTPKTLAWYSDAFKAFHGALGTAAETNHRIVKLRTRGVSAISVNSWLRCINAYMKWMGTSLKFPRLKEEQKILATLPPEH